MKKFEHRNANPLDCKTESPNWEPWLTWPELLEEKEALKRGYQKEIQNGSGKDGL